MYGSYQCYREALGSSITTTLMEPLLCTAGSYLPPVLTAAHHSHTADLTVLVAHGCRA